MLKRFRVPSLSVPSPPSYPTGQQGFTLSEVLITVMVVSVLSAIAAPTIQFGNNPVKDNSSRLSGHLKLLRAKAISQTSAYRIKASPVGGTPLVVGTAADRSSASLVIEKASQCNAPDTAWTRDPGFSTEDLRLDQGVQIQQVEVNNASFSTNAWAVCYNSRGLATQNLKVTLKDNRSSHKPMRVTVFPSGGVDVEEL